MQNVEKLINDILSMEFDIIIPISGTIIAIIVAFIVFMLRYLSFKFNRWLYRNAPPRNVGTVRKARSGRKDWHNILSTASYCDPRTKQFLQQSIEQAQMNIAGENSREQKQDVIKVLENLGFENIEEDRRYVEVLNKIDLLTEDKKQNIAEHKKHYMAPLSALSGEGCKSFLLLLDKKLSQGYEVKEIEIGVSNGRLISWIYDNTEVIAHNLKEDRIRFKLKLDSVTESKLQKMLKPL